MEEVIICRTRENDEKFEFRVSLLDNTDRTVHDVSLSHEDFETFGLRSESPERFVERCFDFLLEGLTKDSIRSEFDIGTMAEYFPDFAEEMRGGMMRRNSQELWNGTLITRRPSHRSEPRPACRSRTSHPHGRERRARVR